MKHLFLILVTLSFSYATRLAAQSDSAFFNLLVDRSTSSVDSALRIDNIPEPDPLVLDSAVRSDYHTAVRAYYRYRAGGFEHRSQVFAWQLQSSKIVFIAVLLLLTVGVVFSGIQFRKGMLEAKRDGEMTDNSSRSMDLKTELEATTSGIKVSSPVLGVIILLISLLFFYLYLIYIDPVGDTF